MRAVRASGWDWDEGSSAAASVGAVAVMMGFKTPPEKCVGFRKIKQNAKVKCVGTCSMLGTQSPTCNWFMFTFSGLSAKLAVIRHNDTTIWARDIQNVNIILCETSLGQVWRYFIIVLGRTVCRRYELWWKQHAKLIRGREGESHL